MVVKHLGIAALAAAILASNGAAAVAQEVDTTDIAVADEDDDEGNYGLLGLLGLAGLLGLRRRNDHVNHTTTHGTSTTNRP
jgi:MYXO-CTERM domain-containing protein